MNQVTFRGLTFTETDYVMPAEGIISPQAAVPIRGSIVVEHARGGVFDGCTFSCLGGYALELGRGAQRWLVVHSEIRDAAAGGIRIGEGGANGIRTGSRLAGGTRFSTTTCIGSGACSRRRWG